MRQLCFALVTILPLMLAACDSDDEEMDSSTGGSGIATGGSAASTGGGPAATGGRAGAALEFTDLPGKIRFANFVSDGMQGLSLDLYWGVSIQDSEKVGTIEYKEVTEFLVPRRIDFPLLDEDEARYFIVLEGDVESNAATFLVQDDVTFTAETVTTVALASVPTPSGIGLGVSFTSIYDDRVTVPPSGMAHVYDWTAPFNEIDDGDFVKVGTAELCEPDTAEVPSINSGEPALIPGGTSGLTVFDVEVEEPLCRTGAVPSSDVVEAGQNYLLIGEAETLDKEARTAVLLKLGAEN